MAIRLKRVYEPAAAADGCRILVDRLWPRGLSKRKARVDLWIKDAAPSPGLRRWFGHEADRWPEFKRRYAAELKARPEGVAPILARARRGRVTFLFAARDPRRNNAAALKQYLERRLRRSAR
jgi:uncharacterized protein YeaO (DUF488 family)